jgi:type III secretion control protein HpaP
MSSSSLSAGLISDDRSRMISVRRLRVESIRPTEDASGDGTQVSRDSGIDYESLLRLPPAPHRPVRRVSRDSASTSHSKGSQNGESADDGMMRDAAFTELSLCRTHTSSIPQAGYLFDELEHQLIGARLEHAAVPLMPGVLAQDQRITVLLGTLAQRIATFCGNPAIVGAGHWYAHVPLAPNLLPDTDLHLTLSPLALELRFEASSSDSRQLILDHSAMLKSELCIVLHAWGEPRVVNLTVW